MRPTTIRSLASIAICGVLGAATIACGADSNVSSTDQTSPTTPAATETTNARDAAATTDATVAPATTAQPSSTSNTTEAAEPVDDELIAQAEAVLATMVGPDTMAWDGSPAVVPPTAAVAAIRIPGRDDVVIAVGDNVDGTPTVVEDKFLTGGLAESLTRTVGFQLVDDGTLDPAATVDRWAPTMPSADRVTVQMLLDNTTGWGDWLVIEPDPILTDLTRVWTLPEIVEVIAPAITVVGEPGTPSNDVGNSETVLGLIMEKVTGHSLVELVHDRVAEPAGLTDTGLLAGTFPTGTRHGLFPFEGTTMATSDVADGQSYTTFNQAHNSSISTTADLLDLLDVWKSGNLFTTDRIPSPDRFAPEPADHPYLDVHAGVGVPFTAFCPCTPVDGGIEPAAFGRTPVGLATNTAMLQFADGISVVVNINSHDAASIIDLTPVAEQLHDLAAAAS